MTDTFFGAKPFDNRPYDPKAYRFSSLSDVLDVAIHRRMTHIPALADHFANVTDTLETFTRFSALFYTTLERGRSKFRAVDEIFDPMQMHPDVEKVKANKTGIFMGMHIIQGGRAWVLRKKGGGLVRIKLYRETGNDYVLEGSFVVSASNLTGGDKLVITDVLPTYDVAEYVTRGWTANKLNALESLVAEIGTRTSAPLFGQNSYHLGGNENEAVLSFGSVPLKNSEHGPGVQSVVAVERKGVPVVEVFRLHLNMEGLVMSEPEVRLVTMEDLPATAKEVAKWMELPKEQMVKEKPADAPRGSGLATEAPKGSPTPEVHNSDLPAFRQTSASKFYGAGDQRTGGPTALDRDIGSADQAGPEELAESLRNSPN